MEIKKIVITKLFGYLDYEIPFKQENITLIHGPNGCGKTTIIKLINAIFNWNYAIIKNTPFEKISIHFKDKKVLTIRRLIEQSSNNASSPLHRKQITIKIKYSGISEEYIPQVLSSNERTFPLDIIGQSIPELERIGQEEWVDKFSNEILSIDDILELYAERLPFTNRPIIHKPDWFENLLNQTNVLFIQSQRLTKTTFSNQERYYSGRQINIRDAVELYSNEIKDIISKKLVESGIIAQSKDRTFPSRLLQSDFPNEISQQEITDKFNQMEEKSKKLIAAGISEEQASLPFPKEKIEDMEKKVLWLYLQDVEEKLKIFDDLQPQIETFMTIINSKLNGQEKSFEVSRKQGLMFRSFLGETQELSPKTLSSGEQHQLVVFYALLFKAKKGSLVLIDEPEISQHLEWQRRFLRDLSKVVELGNHTFLIATHSPQIINDHWDWVVALKGGVEK